MRRRSSTGGEPVKARRRRAATLKRRNGSKTARRRGSSAAVKETEIDRLRRELNEALEQQTATSEVLGVISRSKFELQPVLQSVVDTAARLCRAKQAVIFRLEGGVYRFAAGYSIVPAYLEIERRTPISPGSGTLIGRAAMTGQVARIDDAWNDPLYEKKEDAKVGGHRSMIGVPLMREGKPVGVIGLSRSRVDPFAEREIGLVTTFADQAVIAIENARLLDELRQSLEQQIATSEVLQVISSSPGDLEPVFVTMLENAVHICGATFGTMLLFEGEQMRRVAMHNAPPAYAEYAAKKPVVHYTVSGLIRRLWKTKQPVDTADILMEDADDPLAKFAGARSIVSVPMLKDDALIGLIGIFRQEVRPFTDKQIELVQNFAAQAVIAIENARLLNELYDLEGALSVAKRRNCGRLPWVAIASRSSLFCSPEPLSQDELQRAESALRELVLESEYEASGWSGLGLLLRDRLKHYDEAEQAYRRATEIDPQDSLAWVALAGLLQDDLKRYDEAEHAYRRAIEIDPHDAFAPVWLGVLLQNLKRYDEAEQAYRKAIGIEPSYAFAWVRLGMLLQNLKRYDEAEQAYRKAIGIEPPYAFAWVRLGMLFHDDLKRYNEAEQAYRRAIEIDPHDAFARVWLGMLLQNLKRYDEAEQAYRRATEIDPPYPYAWVRLGMLLQDDLKRFDEAEQAYRRAVEIDSQYAIAWVWLGMLLQDDLKRFDEAEQAYRRAIEIDSQYAIAWHRLARLLEHDVRQQVEAIDAYCRSVELEPEREWTSFRIVSALLLARSLGRGPQRVAALRSVTRMHNVLPNNLDIQFVLVGLLVLSEQWNEARPLLERLCQTEFEKPDVWTFSAVVVAGHVTEAISLLERTGADQRWRPLYEALRGVQAGSADYLRRVAPEVRTVAAQILAEIAPELVKQTSKRHE